jgi:sugar phosphate permease
MIKPCSSNPSGTTDIDALYQKIAWRLMPFLFFGYVIAYVDRMNVSFAKLQMAGDLGFSDTVYGFGAGIFFVGYFFCEVPSNIMLHKIGARIWLTRIMIMWGLISSAMMFVDSPLSFYGLRLLLGMGEAGFFPGIILYLTYWFPNRYRAKCTAIFIFGIAFSGIISGPISGWLMESLSDVHDLRGWQWLFLLEGLLAVILGCCAPFILLDKPEKASWLTTEEKQLVCEHLATEQSLAVTHHSSLKQTLTNLNIWLLSGIYFLLVAGLYSISFWLPQIVHDFGQANLLITGLLSSIPYLCASIGMFFIARYSDKHNERYRIMQICMLVGAIGLFASAWFQSPITLSLLSLSIACTGIMACFTIFWTIPTKLLSNINVTAAAGIAMINSVGGLGGYIGPFLLGWIKDATHNLSAGLYALAVGLLMAMILLMRLRKQVNI